jgi:hypothetical protein
MRRFFWHPFAKSKQSRRTATRPRGRLGLEVLEVRCLPAPLSFAVQPLPVAVNTLLNPLDGIQVKSPDGGRVTLALGNNPGAAQLVGTVTQTPDPGTGIATFEDLRLVGGSPGNGYTLLATSPGDDPATSAPFAVTAGPANLYIATTVPSANAGDGLGPITVQILDASGAISKGADGSTLTLFVAHNASADPAGAKFLLPNGDTVDHLTATVANGQAVFGDPNDPTSPPVRLMKAGVGFTLTAEVTGNDAIKKATSNRFLITAGDAAQLAFQNPPSFAIVNQVINEGGRIPPFAATGVTVQVEDQFGNPVPDSSAMVTIGLKDKPDGSFLHGPNGVAAVNGLATFNGIYIDKAGTGYTLQATATGLTATVSGAFKVLPGNPTLRFLDASGNPVSNPIGTGPFAVGSRLPTILVEADATDGQQVVGADGQQVTLGPPGRLVGETTATVAFDPTLGKSVARFSNVYVAGGSAGAGFPLQAQFLSLPFAPTPPSDAITLSPGPATKLLFTNLGEIDNVVAGNPLTSNKGAIQVLVQDAYGNTAAGFNGAVWIGVNRAAPNSLTTPVGSSFDPTGKSFGTYVKVNAVNGVATFPNVFINRASTQYQLAVGSPDFALNTDTSQPFDVTIGEPAQVAFLVGPDPHGVGAYQRITGDGNQVIAAVEDKVGNIVVKDSGRNITMSLVTNPDPGRAVLAGRDKVQDQQGVAVFDLMYITDTNDNPIPGFQLQASSTGLTTSPLSTAFPLNPSPGGIGRTLPQPNFSVATQPADVPVNTPLTFSFQVSAAGQPATAYDQVVNVLVELLHADGTPAASVFIGRDKIKQPSNGVVAFANDLVVTQPGPYVIRALLDVLPANASDGEIITNPFTVTGTLTSGGPPAGPATASPPQLLGGTADPNGNGVVDLDLASFTENFNYITAFRAYQLQADGTPQPLSQQFQPPSLPLAPGATQPPPMVQPNVSSGFNQVPVSTKWWASLMFQRTKTDPASGLPQDSQGNQLFPMFADPFAVMVNSYSTFAGLGLAYLTHPFVVPAGQFVANDPGLPDGRQPGNVQYEYSHGSTGAFPDQRLYQDLAVGLAGVQADAKVLSYSDTTVTLDWNGQLQATLGEGLPFAYFLAPKVNGTRTIQLVTANPNRTATVTAYDENGNKVSSDQDLDPNVPNAVRLEIQYTVMDFPYPGSQGPAVPITVDNNYALFLPKGVHWSLSGGTLTADLTTAGNYFSVAILPDKPANADPKAFYNDAFKFYRARAYSFVTGTASSFSYNEATGLVTTTFTAQTQAREQGAGLIDNHPLQALYPNQWLALYPDATGKAASPNTPYTYQVTRGTLEVWDGPTFATGLQYHGSLPLVPPLPDDGTSHADLWNNYLLPYLVGISSQPTFDGSLTLDKLIPYGQNNYLDFQSMFGATQLIPVLVEVSQSKDPGLTDSDRALALSCAQKIFTIVEADLGAWLSAKDDGDLQLLYYQPPALQEANAPGGIGWQALLSEAPGFLSSESLNDQNLIYGYFIKTAATIDQYDSQWGNTRTPIDNGQQTLAGTLGEIVNLIVANVSNYDRTSTAFPFLRNFDVAQGHSWADGAANGLLGTNMESSSEAINYDSALIQWGEATGNQSLRDLGVYLYTTEVASVNLYYFNNPTPYFNVPPGTVTNAFPAAFTTNPTPPPAGDNRPLITILHNASTGINGGFVGDIPAAQTGIQIVPLNGSSLYLGSNTAFVNLVYTFARSNLTQQGGVPVKPSTYLSVLDPYLAFLNAPYNGKTALQTYLDDLPKVTSINPGVPIDTVGFNVHWIEMLQDYGQVDTSVTADTVSYAVFIKTPGDASTRTYVAYNPDATAMTVTFSDGFTMTVPGRSMLVSNAEKTTVTTQTYPDLSQQTPANRFFFSSTPDSNSGDYTFLSGQTGTGESSVNIPPPAVVTVTIAASPNGATESGATVTITTTAAHGFIVGQTVQIAGVGVAGYNGTFTIQSVPTPTSFTYTATQSGLAASGGGTATSSNHLTAPTDPSQKATFQITGLTGTLQGDSAQAFFSLWVDPQFPVGAQQPAFIRVQITYQDGPVSEGGTGQTVKQLYDGFNLSNNPGYVDGFSVQGGGVIGNPDTGGAVQPLLPTLTDATVTVEIWARDGNNAKDENGQPIPIRLRTDAAAQQGRVSYLDLPYNFTQINGQPVDTLKLRGLPLVPKASLGAPPPAAPESPVFPVYPTADLYGPHPDGDANQAFVKGLYHAILGRDGEASGIAFWVNALANGATREQAAEGFINSPEHRRLEVDSYYQTFLGRSAEADAASGYWVGLLLAHGDEEEVLKGILTSPEYTAEHALDQAFVRGLYSQLLGRAADDSGATFWEQRLGAGANRADVVDGFVRSREAATVAADSFYAAYLQRQGDPLQEYWIDALTSGTLTYGQEAAGFLAAPEFFARAGANVP